jgi:hypothetical protein
VLSAAGKSTSSLGASLGHHVEKLYLAFARDVYALAAAPANNLQSLYSLYHSLAGKPGLPLDALHGFVVGFVCTLYHPTLASLHKTASTGSPSRVQVGTAWMWYPLPFFGVMHAAAKEHMDAVLSQHQPGGVSLSREVDRYAANHQLP